MNFTPSGKNPKDGKKVKKKTTVKSHKLEKGKDSEETQSIQNLNCVTLMWKTVAYLQVGFSNTKLLSCRGKKKPKQTNL